MNTNSTSAVSYTHLAQAAFETVLLDELPQDTGWQDEGLQVSYSLCNGRVSCVLHRTVRADGKLWRITMSCLLYTSRCV